MNPATHNALNSLLETLDPHEVAALYTLLESVLDDNSGRGFTLVELLAILAPLTGRGTP